jgi:hypothetical protein
MKKSQKFLRRQIMSKKRQLIFEFDTKQLEVTRSVHINADQEKLIKGIVALYLEYMEIKRIEGQRKGKK